MTLVFALQGQDEIVVAADSMAHDGPDSEGRYKSSVRKLHPLPNHWLFGFADGQSAYAIYNQIKAQGWESQLSANIALGAQEYAEKMRDLYEKSSYQDSTTAILCGVSNGEPATYSWSLSRDDKGQVKFAGAQIRPERAGIGARQHGALYFASAFHRRDMDTKQRISLAYFCLSEAAKHDLRVGGHIDVALVKENSAVRLFSQAELSEVERASMGIAESLARRFVAPGPSISGLISA